MYRLNPTPAELTNRFGIYVHVPFCVHKCSYCDFYSFTKYSTGDFEVWLDALLREIDEAKAFLKDKPLSTVTSLFFGGGTPSLLPTSVLERAFDKLSSAFSFDSAIEITLESNPETLDLQKLQEWKASLPINRVSLGAQSFQPKYLEKLERLASAESVRKAARLLHQVGYSNFNLDLIVGIPGQTVEELKSDIQEAVSLSPTHLSNYNLTLKPGHLLYAQLPGEELSHDLYQAAVSEIERQGFSQYEISNYSRPGKECAHNLLYWSGADFLGLGPSAASRFFWDGVFWHRKQLSDFGQYAKSRFQDQPFEKNTVEQSQLEAAFLELRLNAGVDLDHFEARYGKDLRKSRKWNLFHKGELLESAGGTVRLTSKGRLLADSVAAELV